MQKTLLILGAGTGGTMVANRMFHLLDSQDWRIVVVDRDPDHYYQPGFLFIPFDIYTAAEVIKPKREFLPHNVEVVFSDIELIEPHQNRVTLAHEGRVIYYDEMVIATGSHLHPEKTPGLVDGGGWRENIFDFYTVDGAKALATFLQFWEGGRLVVNVADMPIKCPIAPLEFLSLADWYFTEHGLRDKVELAYATPLPSAVTQHMGGDVMNRVLQEKGIHLITDFNVNRVEANHQVIRAQDGRMVGYDLLVSIPAHMGADVIARSGMGNTRQFVPTDPHTLRAKGHENIWVIGDAGDLPTAKMGSVARFALDIVTDNLLNHIHGHPLTAKFDGHANCFVEAGYGKAYVFDFNYETEPLPGKFPVPGVGPFSLLKQTAINHWGKLAMRWMYWNVILMGRDLPVGSAMRMTGKHVPQN